MNSNKAMEKLTATLEASQKDVETGNVKPIKDTFDGMRMLLNAKKANQHNGCDKRSLNYPND